MVETLEKVFLIDNNGNDVLLTIANKDLEYVNKILVNNQTAQQAETILGF